MATVAIGDVHGNLEALEGVLALVTQEVGAGDTVVFLGDYVDRGLDSASCIERILNFRAASAAEVIGLLGNHEDWLLQTWRDPTEHSWLLGMDATETIQSYSIDAALEIGRAARAAGAELHRSRIPLPYDKFFNAVPRAHLEFLQSLRPYHTTEDAVCVHGGVDPALGTLEKQSQDSVVWGVRAFQYAYTDDAVLVYGHWRNARLCADGRAEPNVIGRTVGVDSSDHGTLMAVKMPDGLVLQSNGERSWVYSSTALRDLATRRDAPAAGRRHPS